MRELQRHLTERFEGLRDSRTGPVFFIEHGIERDEISDLMVAVRSALREHPLADWFWDEHKLPLIAAATEVGYRYRGAGTDFWPILEKSLEHPLGSAARKRIRDLFRVAATALGGARPACTPWSTAFHLIAWPITHALVPIEFHRPLALALASLRINVADSDDEVLYRAIRVAAASPSARFATFLEDSDLVVRVAKSLLGGGSGELCAETTERITQDLASDEVARRGVAVARRVQRTTPRDGRRRARESQPVLALKGALQLRCRDEVVTLEASLPPIESEIASRLRRALRRRRFAPRLWGSTARVPCDQLLSGLPFSVRLVAAPSSGSALLPELEGLDIEEELREVLARFDLHLALPLLFAVGADQEVARQVKGPAISGHRSYWSLTESTLPSLARLPVLGDVGPFTCHVLNPSEEGVCQALSDLGFAVRYGISVAVVGAAALEREALTPTFLAGDERFVLGRRAHPEGIHVELNGSATHATDDEVVRVVVSEGQHLVRVSSGSGTREFKFRGVSEPERSASSACGIVLQSSDLTVEALLGGSLAFGVESFAPLEGLTLSVEIEVSGRRMGASSSLGPLPQTITSSHDAFSSLLDDTTRELLLRGGNAILRLGVGCLCERSWVLDRRVRPCWWVRETDGFALVSELGELAFGEVSSTTPHQAPARGIAPSDDGATLMVPIGVDVLDHGAGAEFVTLCVAPSSGGLKSPRILKPRIVRRRRAEGGAVGLETLVEAFLRWSLAESDTVVAEIRRQQVADELDGWIAETCCGAAWCDRELGIQHKGPWELLADIGHKRGLGRDSYFNLPDEVWGESLSVASAALRSELPELWSLSRPPFDLAERDWLIVEAACGKAYETVSRRYRDIGRAEIADSLADADPTADFDREAWQSILELVVAQSDLAEVAELLMPTDSAAGLMDLDATVMSLDDLCDELSGWARSCRSALAGEVPGEGTLRAILALWTEPELAVRLEWRDALGTMLAERLVSRAARYLALRSREARSGGGA
jgi:hypothetical protein